MSITSLSFTVFSLIVLVAYYFLPRRLQNYWLLLASYVFYVSWDWRFALTLLLLTVANFAIGHGLSEDRKYPTGLLWAGIVLNILSLVLFKTADFFVPELVSLLSLNGIHIRSDGLQFILPIGLSFRVLENISYLVDISRKQITPARDFFAFSLYLVYFPKMVAGPIERARSFLPKLAAERVVNNEVLRHSFVLIMVGLVRKIVIADSLSLAIPTGIFSTPGLYSALELLAWLFVYAFSLYNDFAGYTSMMRGVSGLFGIPLSPNFNLPYFARSFNEFWSRWHITLSQWLRDYIFFPTRRIFLKNVPDRFIWLNFAIPPLVTMLVSGLWHGTSWNMLLWGGLHGVYLIIEHLLRSGNTGPAPAPSRLRQAISTAVIFLLVSLAWVPFMLEMPTALAYWRGLLDWSTVGAVLANKRLLLHLLSVMIFMLPVIGLDWLQQHYQDEAFFIRWPRPAQSVLLAAAFFLIFIATQSAGGPAFVYQGF